MSPLYAVDDLSKLNDHNVFFLPLIHNWGITTDKSERTTLVIYR